ncbi:MAG: exodeoxyribonuclease VII small subunit [Ruminococcaceae bacterium]|nr:exodeoxyribonuclease VII small subunit [Oscillospiraceae bacterium]
MAEKKSAKSFEQTMQELEETVEALEAGQVELDQALALFEKGIKLSRACQKFLDQAEQKVTRLTQEENGEIKEYSFE